MNIETKTCSPDDTICQTQIQPMVDELQFVDPDIAEQFRTGGGWMIGVPTMVQFNRNVAKLIAAMEKKPFDK